MLHMSLCLHLLKVNWSNYRVFPDIPVTSFKNNKNSKSYLLITVLSVIIETERSEPCGVTRPPCKLYSYMKNKNTFESNY